MITAHDMNWHPDAIRHDNGDPEHFAANQHRLMDGVIYAPATNLKLGFEGSSADQCAGGAGLLFISIGDVGICSALPPPSLRALAASLIQLADMAEANAKASADAAIAKAAGK